MTVLPAVLAERSDDELLKMVYAEFSVKRELRKRGYRQRFQVGHERPDWYKPSLTRALTNGHADDACEV